MSASTMRTVTPLYWLITTSPVPASVLSASRTGVLDTPNCAANSVSTSAWPGVNCPVRMRCLIASSTYCVRDGIGMGMGMGTEVMRASRKSRVRSRVSDVAYLIWCIASHI